MLLGLGKLIVLFFFRFAPDREEETEEEADAEEEEEVELVDRDGRTKGERSSQVGTRPKLAGLQRLLANSTTLANCVLYLCTRCTKYDPVSRRLTALFVSGRLPTQCA